MAELPEHLFLNPIWHALQTSQRHFALAHGDAVRYSPDIAPFVAVAAPTESALGQLAELLAPDEACWLLGETFPLTPELFSGETLDCLQMVLPQVVTPPVPRPAPLLLTPEDAPEMFDLISLAYPGFYRMQTHEMGTYYGFRSAGKLVAMGGERIRLPGYTEISGVCTHPEHRGNGYAVSIMWELVRKHRRDGVTSWLNVSVKNQPAVDLYLHMGFRIARQVTLYKVTRAA